MQTRIVERQMGIIFDHQTIDLCLFHFVCDPFFFQYVDMVSSYVSDLVPFTRTLQSIYIREIP